jgi:hypothetical protein
MARLGLAHGVTSAPRRSRRGTSPAQRRQTHIPNGGKRSKGEAGKMKALGVRKGVLDLALFWPAGGYVGLFIEMKSMTGVASTDQKEWIDHLRQTGWRVEVCRSLDTFTAIIEDYLRPALARLTLVQSPKKTAKPK